MQPKAKIMLTALLLLGTATPLCAEEPKGKPAGGPPPMLVETAAVTSGAAEPMAPFIGTVYFARSARVAAEVEGVVEAMYVDDGQAVKHGAPLVRLDDALLATEVDGTRAAYEQNQVDLEQARRDFERIKVLHEQDSIATTEYESYQTTVRRHEKLGTLLKARLDRQLLEQRKKTIRAPFDGVVVETLVETGEWVPAGGAVALVADNRTHEVLVDIPANLIGFLKAGRQVPVQVNSHTLQGAFLTIIPKGDIATRTFSAKFGIDDAPLLVEGMEARILLPTAAASESLLVPRDALVNTFGMDVVFIIEADKARMVPVQINGYTTTEIAVSGAGLEAGQAVIVKGNERVQDGAPVRTAE